MVSSFGVCLLNACLLHSLPPSVSAWSSTKQRPEIFDEDSDERICQQATRYLYDRHNRTRSSEEGDDDDDDDGKITADSDTTVRVLSSNFTGNQPIKVSISSDRPFFGVLLQTRWQETGVDGTTGGRFRAASAEASAKTVSCGGGGGEGEDGTLIAWFDQGSTSQRFLWAPSTEFQRLDRVQFL